MIGKTNAITSQSGGDLDAFLNGTLDVLEYDGTSIRAYSCYNSSIEDARLPNVTNIPPLCFYNCRNLENIYAPEATKVGEQAFSVCTGLKNIYLPNVVELDNASFNQCAYINTIVLGVVKKIGNGTFSNTNLDFSNNDIINLEQVESIGTDAFSSCHLPNKLDLKNITDLSYKSLNYSAPKTSEVLELYTYKMKRWNGLDSTNWYNFSKIHHFGLECCEYLLRRCTATEFKAPKLLTLWRICDYTENSVICTNMYIGNGSMIRMDDSSSFNRIVTTLYLNSNEPYAIPSSSVLDKITNIYVPRQCLTLYKNATNWSSKASSIYAYDTDNILKIAANDVVSASTCSCTIDCNIGDNLLLCATVRYSYTAPTGWTLLHETSSYTPGNAYTQKSLVFTKTATATTETVTLTQSSNGRIYMDICNIGNKTAYVNTSKCVVVGDTYTATTITKDTANPVILFCGRNYSSTSSNDYAIAMSGYHYFGETGNWDEFIALGTQYRTAIIYSEKEQGTTIYENTISSFDYLGESYNPETYMYAIIYIELRS